MARLFLLNHPDAEPGYHKRTIGSVNNLSWNATISHWRKFIQRDGMYLDNGTPKSSSLCFWGEYEPYSQATIIRKTKPKAIHTDLRPVRLLASMPPKALNTDPYIYGCFRNICCRRRAKYQKGDILIFGTFQSGTIFEFDTVIVVKEIISCHRIPANDQYRLASIDPLINPPFDFVDGVVYSPEEKYYSFIPCLPQCDFKKAANLGFAKPFLDTNALFGQKAKHGSYGWSLENIPMNNTQDMKRYWKSIVKAVEEAGFKEGILVDKIGNEKIF